MTKTYLIQYTLVIEVPDEPVSARLEAEHRLLSPIETAIEEVFYGAPPYLGYQTKDVALLSEEEAGTGRCVRCHLWVSRESGVRGGLNHGEQINGHWYCQEHRPRKRPRMRTH